MRMNSMPDSILPRNTVVKYGMPKNIMVKNVMP